MLLSAFNSGQDESGAVGSSAARWRNGLGWLERGRMPGQPIGGCYSDHHAFDAATNQEHTPQPVTWKRWAKSERSSVQNQEFPTTRLEAFLSA